MTFVPGAVPPNLPTNRTDDSPRDGGLLAGWLNDIHDTLNKAQSKGVAIQTYVPTFTSEFNPQPVLSTDGSHKQLGHFIVIDGVCHFRAWIRWGNVGRVGGTGHLRVGLPLQCDMRMAPAADGAAGHQMTSDYVGYADLTRMENPLDVFRSHLKTTAHCPPASGGLYVEMCDGAMGAPQECYETVVTTAQNDISNAGADLTGATVTFDQKNPNRRWRLDGYMAVTLDTVGARSALLQIKEGSTNISAPGSGAESFSDSSVGFGLDSAGVFCRSPIILPTQAVHTYKLFAFADSGGTFDVSQCMITATQMPGLGPMNAPFDDYVSGVNPWPWANYSGRAQIRVTGAFPIAPGA
jgi:hypothetical protein